MGILNALLDAFLWLFWRFVVWNGGPRHDSYGYAIFAQWQAKQRLQRFLRGG